MRDLNKVLKNNLAVILWDSANDDLNDCISTVENIWINPEFNFEVCTERAVLKSISEGGKNG